MLTNTNKAAQMTIRGVSREVIEALEASALRNNRTREGEARAALQAWAQPEARKIEHATKYCLDVSQRLQHALDQVKRHVIRHSELTPSHLAEQIGEPSASQVIAGFHGERELPFAVLEKLAVALGVSSEWIKHGTSTPYASSLLRLEGSVDESVDMLLGSTPLDTLHLLRTSDATGGLYVIRKHKGSPLCDVFYTPYHVSESIGAGGEADLCMLFQVLEQLYKRYTRKLPSSDEERIDCVIKSYLVEPKVLTSRETFEQVHPLALVKEAKEAPWWEDVWDNSQNHEHWPGMLDLRRRIQSAIASKKARSQAE